MENTSDSYYSDNMASGLCHCHDSDSITHHYVARRAENCQNDGQSLSARHCPHRSPLQSIVDLRELDVSLP